MGRITSSLRCAGRARCQLPWQPQQRPAARTSAKPRKQPDKAARQKAEQVSGLEQVIAVLEQHALELTASLERAGVAQDVPGLQRLSREYEQLQHELATKLDEWTALN